MEIKFFKIVGKTETGKMFFSYYDKEKKFVHHHPEKCTNLNNIGVARMKDWLQKATHELNTNELGLRSAIKYNPKNGLVVIDKETLNKICLKKQVATYGLHYIPATYIIAKGK
jgi:hypothetical protein